MLRSPRTGNSMVRTRRFQPSVDRRSIGLVALLVGAALVTLATGAHAALYKWTDARGVVHYSDQLPPDAVNRANYQLNRQGLTIRKTEQARPVELRTGKDDSEIERERQAQRSQMLAKRRDRALVESYTNEAEIELAKTRAVATIDGQVQSAQAFIGQMTRRREELEGKKAGYAPRPVPGSIEREIETIDAELARQHEYIAARQKESAAVAARYESDRQRFHELKSGDHSGSILSSNSGRLTAADPASMELTAPNRSGK
jgi:hypothetical protein